MFHLYGSHFSIVTDHRALCHIMKSNKRNRRLQVFILFLQEFSFDVEYVPEKNLPHADRLSRQVADDEFREDEYVALTVGKKEMTGHCESKDVIPVAFWQQY